MAMLCTIYISDENFLKGGMRTGFPGYGFYWDWLYREKISKKFGRAKLEEHVGGIEGL